MSKADIDGTLFRFAVYKDSRGRCNQCGNRDNTVLVRLVSPIKKELRTCYSCLVKFLLKEAECAEEIEEKAKEARERIAARQKAEEPQSESIKDEPEPIEDKPKPIGYARLSDVNLIEREGQWIISKPAGSNSKKEGQD